MYRLIATAMISLALVNHASAGFLIATDNTPGLFDGSSGNRTFTFTGLEPGFGSGIITNVTLSVNFAKADGQAFNPPFPGGTPFHDEIVFRLSSPNGTTVNLISQNSFSSGSTAFDGTITFDMSALNLVNVNPNLPQAGTFRPVGNLGTMFGGNALGNWNLFIQDTGSLDALRYRSAELVVTTSEAVPAPAAIWVGLGGIGVLRLVRRRK